MPPSKEIRFNQEKQFVYIKLPCRLTFKLLLEVFEEVTTSPLYNPGMGRIWDINDADLSSLDDETLKRISLISTNRSSEVSLAKVALISNQPLNESIVKLFKIHSKELNQTNVEIFKSKDQAEAWISPG